MGSHRLGGDPRAERRHPGEAPRARLRLRGRLRETCHCEVRTFPGTIMSSPAPGCVRGVILS